MSRLVVVDPLPLKSALGLSCVFLPLSFGVAVWANAGPRRQALQ